MRSGKLVIAVGGGPTAVIPVPESPRREEQDEAPASNPAPSPSTR
jgi:hypothetical protein